MNIEFPANIESKEKEPKKLLYRYENSKFGYSGGITETSHPEIVGQWFTDNIQSLKDYIHMRQPGGDIVIVEIPVSKLDTFHVSNHPIANSMDVEDDNWIIPKELLDSAKRISLTVPSQNSHKFIFKEWQDIDTFIDHHIPII
jgi:hypothetical protein